MIFDFTKAKFQNLNYEQQHKKQSELLSYIYREFNKLDVNCLNNLIEKYNTYQSWLGLEQLNATTFESISMRYHFHLQQAKIYLKEHNLLPQVRKYDRQQPIIDKFPYHVYLDNIRSAHNIGSILRTAEAFSFNTVYFTKNMPFQDHKMVKDVSMGASEFVHCVQDISLDKLPKPIIVLETSPQAVSLFDFIFPKEFTLVVGNEEFGCSEQSLNLADYLIEIPLTGRKNSLNVANCFAIVANEITRQRYNNLKGNND